MTLLSQMPEGSTFTIADRHIVGHPESFSRGHCQATMIPTEVYLLEQSLLGGLAIVEGICHIEQRNKTFGDVDTHEWKSLTIDDGLLVIPVVHNNALS